MANQQKTPFNRVANGYDPNEVAAFAAKALAWKNELTSLRSEVEAARQQLDRYETVIGAVEVAEKEAAEIAERASSEAADVTRRAEADAAKIVQRAELEATEIVQRAHAEATEITERAHVEATEAAQNDDATEITEPALSEFTDFVQYDEPTIGNGFAPAGQEQAADPLFPSPSTQDADPWLTPDPADEQAPDPIDQIFTAVDDTQELDPVSERERRVAAATANLWKRRGVIAPPD